MSFQVKLSDNLGDNLITLPDAISHLFISSMSTNVFPTWRTAASQQLERHRLSSGHSNKSKDNSRQYLAYTSRRTWIDSMDLLLNLCLSINPHKLVASIMATVLMSASCF